jgi:hypothetical protein
MGWQFKLCYLAAPRVTCNEKVDVAFG